MERCNASGHAGAWSGWQRAAALFLLVVAFEAVALRGSTNVLVSSRAMRSGRGNMDVVRDVDLETKGGDKQFQEFRASARERPRPDRLPSNGDEYGAAEFKLDADNEEESDDDEEHEENEEADTANLRNHRASASGSDDLPNLESKRRMPPSVATQDGVTIDEDGFEALKESEWMGCTRSDAAVCKALYRLVKIDDVVTVVTFQCKKHARWMLLVLSKLREELRAVELICVAHDVDGNTSAWSAPSKAELMEGYAPTLLKFVEGKSWVDSVHQITGCVEEQENDDGIYDTDGRCKLLIVLDDILSVKNGHRAAIEVLGDVKRSGAQVALIESCVSASVSARSAARVAPYFDLRAPPFLFPAQAVRFAFANEEKVSAAFAGISANCSVLAVDMRKVPSSRFYRGSVRTI